MKLDIRYPIGFLFLIIGALLAVFGAMRHHRVDLYWGGVQVAFGALMAGLAKAGSSKSHGPG
jgi:hypothetical protein